MVQEGVGEPDLVGFRRQNSRSQARTVEVVCEKATALNAFAGAAVGWDHLTWAHLVGRSAVSAQASVKPAIAAITLTLESSVRGSVHASVQANEGARKASPAKATNTDTHIRAPNNETAADALKPHASVN